MRLLDQWLVGVVILLVLALLIVIKRRVTRSNGDPTNSSYPQLVRQQVP